MNINEQQNIEQQKIDQQNKPTDDLPTLMVQAENPFRRIPRISRSPQSSDKQMKKSATTTAINSDALRPRHSRETHNTSINHLTELLEKIGASAKK